jgi:hypothetical protein
MRKQKRKLLGCVFIHLLHALIRPCSLLMVEVTELAINAVGAAAFWEEATPFAGALEMAHRAC